MASLTVSQIIKLILGIFVFVAVVGGVYLIFKGKIFSFFGGLPTGEPVQLIRSLI